MRPPPDAAVRLGCALLGVSRGGQDGERGGEADQGDCLEHGIYLRAELFRCFDHSCSKRLGARTMLRGYAQSTLCGERRRRGYPQASGFFPAQQNQSRRPASMIASVAEFLLAAVRIERERLRARGSWNLAGRGRSLSC